MEIACFNCNTKTDLTVQMELVDFVCPNCGTIYQKDSDGELKIFDKLKLRQKSLYGLKLGQKGILKGEVYTITALLIKSVGGRFHWTEYILQNLKGEFLYLSECDGHWILLEEIEFEKKVGHHPKVLYHDDIRFELYELCNPELEWAEGYFDFKISEKLRIAEYVNPPYLLSFEIQDQNQTAFFGKHISSGEVKKAFSVKDLPYRIGVGQVQPFYVDMRNLPLAFVSVALMIFGTHWYFNADRVEKQVLDVVLNLDNFNEKDYVTPSFELKGSPAPLTVSVNSDVDNSWANLQLALVNEKTNEEVYTSKDIEYYHGYEGGENWSEGSTSEEFNICGVGSGKYHLVVTPMKSADDHTTTNVTVNASWSKPSYRNVWLTYIFMGIVLITIYYLEHYFETKRWENSDYSPYYTEPEDE